MTGEKPAPDRTRTVRPRLAGLCQAPTALAEVRGSPGSLFSDRERSRAAALLANLVRGADRGLREAVCARLAPSDPSTLIAAMASREHDPALALIENAGLLDDPELLRAIWLRVVEARLRELARRDGSIAHGSVEQLAGADDPALAGTALDYIVAEARGLRWFDPDAPAGPELPAEAQHLLVWTAAAALAFHLVGRHGLAPARADTLVGGPAAALLESYREEATLDGCAASLVHRLAQVAAITPALLGEVAREGRLALLLQLLAYAVGVTPRAGWDALCGRSASDRLSLLRAAGLAREDTALLLLRLRSLAAADAPWDATWIEEQLAAFAALSEGEVEAAIARLRLDPVARAALARLEEDEA